MFIPSHTDCYVIVASFCGALAWAITQRYIDRKMQHAAFCISFLMMGIFGGDATLEAIKKNIPGVFTDERPVGAFFWSALIISLITHLVHGINSLRNIQKNSRSMIFDKCRYFMVVS